MDQRPTPLSAREEKLLRGLRRRKKRQEEGLFLAEGIRVVEDLLGSDLAVELVVAASSLEDSPRGAELLAVAERRRLPLRHVPSEDFVRLASTEHPQGVLAVARTPSTTLAEIVEPTGGRMILLLDAVQDPGNLGTLTRTAEALGVAAVVALPGTVDPWNPKSVRSAAGSLFRVPIIQSEWIDASRQLRAGGYVLLAADAAGDPPEPHAGRVALVVGNEGAGISEEIRAGVDGTVGIPLKGRAESLNVAAAAAILLYEFTR